ncbi:hydantoinase B/oxoprolinase family protein [Lichenicoccus sp.]|uniref:hydantoinase B/oxoprolinase family protein n=1 Tax=Lichenicoccus sp. TaxID=2781899 RepID=UPI003D0DA671
MTRQTSPAPERQAAGPWRFWIDRGGTFTDIVGRDPAGALRTAKLLSEDPARHVDAALAGIAGMLGLAETDPIPPGLVAEVRLGTTVATNALLQRRTAPVLLLVDTGYADLLRIGDQSRPDLFELAIRLPEPLAGPVVEIIGRTAADGSIATPLDEAQARAALSAARADGIESCAIALIHAWAHPALEQRLAALALAAGFTQVSTGHAVSPLLRLIPRAQTALVDAALSPILRRHTAHLAAALPGTRLLFMQSSGGLADAAHFTGCQAILSGPAGGIVGAARTAEAAGLPRIISFDMGGTSTDVALYDGSFERSYETRIAGLGLRIPVRVPMLAINTVAAGGGSILRFDGTRLRVGPASAGADPGPCSYGRGGPLTMTDANLQLGRLVPSQFPRLFGADGDAPLDDRAAREGFESLAREVAAATGAPFDPHALAEGFLRVAVDNMANAIREISVRRGQDPGGFALHCFGGAGGQHACLVAAALGMRTVLVHPMAGVLSAFGMALAARVVLREQAVERTLDDDALPGLRELADELARQARDALAEQGVAEAAVTRRLHLRRAGSDAVLVVAFETMQQVRTSFLQQHHDRFGFAPQTDAIIVDAVAVEAAEPGAPPPFIAPPARPPGTAPAPVQAVTFRSAGRWWQAGLFDRARLREGDVVHGPALVSEANAMTVIEPGWRAAITGRGDLALTRGEVPHDAAAGPAPDDLDPLRIALFSNLFMTIAQQAGSVLQNTAQSVNIRERLDFSVALFDAEGRLVANAPHVPVHLGAMGESVRTVLRRRAGTLRPGDAIALNNPFDGGTHLPDITVVTPVFDDPEAAPLFFVGSRGHHADIGGISPGSTPAFSRRLDEEGIVIDDFLLVSDGVLRERQFRDLLALGPHPARSPDVNVADIAAQVAANAYAARALLAAVRQHGRCTMLRAMRDVMANAEESVRRAIARLEDGQFRYRMDGGASLQVAVRIDRARRSAVIDFTGTAAQHPGNFNAPPAVVRAVVLYVFRCLAGDDIPLNDGCLVPLAIVVPPGTFLSPAPGAAVVAGNTEVSQAVCVALFGALGRMACSQGTMNNLLFGDATRQYYETICGGAGAGPDFDGASGVQSHMTNTRMTDPEVLELRYPVRLEAFAIRRGSGGSGARRGGDGVVRRLRFLQPMTAVLVSSRREQGPFGLAGGGAGATGAQHIERADGNIETIGGIAQMALQAGDLLCVQTPGGGGYGRPE